MLETSLIIGLLLNDQPRITSLKVQDQQVKIAVKTSPNQNFNLPPESGEILPTVLQAIAKKCDKLPSGFGVPGFRPGVKKNNVFEMLGTPNFSTSGYWKNTHAVSYQLIPDQVSLGFLFDNNTGRIRQTEVAFSPNVEPDIMLITVNGMLGCKLNEKITTGLQQVKLKNRPNYSFKLNGLRGVIEWQGKDKIYIGVWQSDLH